VIEIPKREFETAPFFVGTLLLLCALTFYYFAVLKIDYEKTALLDLDPFPDAVEYFAQAKALFGDGWPSIRIGYDKLPSRYPLGYPAFMLPWLTILHGDKAILAPFRTNQTLGLLLLFAVFGFYAYLAMPLAGGFASLLLATLPGFFTFCRSSIGEISASALIVLAFMFAYLGLKEERLWKVYLSAVLLGLSVNVHLHSVFFAPLLLAMALLPARGTRFRWFLHCAAAPVVFLLAAGPVMVVNTVEFHSPLKTGYDFWVFDWGRSHPFTLSSIPSNAAALWQEFAPRQSEFLVANLFGTGTLFVPAFIILICVGFLFMRLNRFVICAFLSGLSSFAATVCYRFGADTRFYLPLLMLLIAAAVLPISWATKNLFLGKRSIASLAIFVLFAAACLGYPSRSGYNTVAIDRSQAWDAVDFRHLGGLSTRYIAQKQFAENFGSQPGVVLSDIDPVYLNALLPDSFAAAPIDEKHDFMWSKEWHYDRTQAVALVKRGLAQSRPIYALFVSTEDMQQRAARLPELDDYQWIVMSAPNINDEAVVLQLAPARSGSHAKCDVSPVEQ
jgi:hypothetical protein